MSVSCLFRNPGLVGTHSRCSVNYPARLLPARGLSHDSVKFTFTALCRQELPTPAERPCPTTTMFSFTFSVGVPLLMRVASLTIAEEPQRHESRKGAGGRRAGATNNRPSSAVLYTLRRFQPIYQRVLHVGENRCLRGGNGVSLMGGMEIPLHIAVLGFSLRAQGMGLPLDTPTRVR